MDDFAISLASDVLYATSHEQNVLIEVDITSKKETVAGDQNLG
jgi:hypothetical protein